MTSRRTRNKVRALATERHAANRRTKSALAHKFKPSYWLLQAVFWLVFVLAAVVASTYVSTLTPVITGY